MKIIFLCTFYHRALLFRQQMDALEKRGHYIRTFNSAEYGEGIDEKFLPIIDDKVVHVECWNNLDRIMFFPRQFKIEKQLEKAYDLTKFDLLHSHFLISSGYSAMRIKKKYGLPYIVSVRQTDLSRYMKVSFFRNLASKIIRESNGVLFLSKSYQEQLTREFLPKDKEIIMQKSVVIGNCLENFWRDNCALGMERKIDEKNLKILSVCQIYALKNLPVAAKAVQELTNRGYKVTFTVIGEIKDFKELRKIQQYDFVRILPFMKKEELINEYRNHDIFLMPSRMETFGRVYAEAMSQGLPVLYTKGQGFDNIFPDGTVGYSVPSDDIEYIADRIEDIVKNYNVISSSCLKLCSDFFEDTIIEKIELFYKNALGYEWRK